MERRILKLITCISLVMCLFLPIQALASETDEEPVVIIQPLFTYISSVSADFDIVSGQASMYSVMYASSGVDQVRITSYLQKYENGAWSNVTSWTKLADGTSCTLSKTYGVSSGTYRLRSYFYAYIDGTSVESTNVTTASESC